VELKKAQVVDKGEVEPPFDDRIHLVRLRHDSSTKKQSYSEVQLEPKGVALNLIEAQVL